MHGGVGGRLGHLGGRLGHLGGRLGMWEAGGHLRWGQVWEAGWGGRLGHLGGRLAMLFVGTSVGGRLWCLEEAGWS